MYMNVHTDGKNRIVAVCDRELIGKVIEEDDMSVDLDRYRSFYVGKEAERREVEEQLKSFTSVAVAMGIVNLDDIMYIKETPYIQIYKI